MKKVLSVVAFLAFAGLLLSQARSVYVVEIPLVYADHLDVVYIRVTGTSRTDALSRAGMTVFTEAEWNETCASGFDCKHLKLSDRTKR